MARRLSDERIAQMARRLRALAEPTRLRIVDVLAGGEQPVGRIVEATAADQSNVSKHLQILFHAGSCAGAGAARPCSTR